jgi:hypothetical protein
MTIDLLPSLKLRKVSTGNLLLDPNNPRLKSGGIEQLDIFSADDQNVQHDLEATFVNDESYRLQELEDTITANGWCPVDLIFVRKHNGSGNKFVVLEGNRRVTAIRRLLRNVDLDPSLKKAISKIEVMEITDDIPESEMHKKISYLLGVRHHGALKKWSPYAQASNIFRIYKERTECDWDSFRWDAHVGREISNQLSIPEKQVYERMQVYRLMRQVGDSETVAGGPGGMKHHYYSVCGAALKGKGLSDYIKQDSGTLLLDEESVQKIEELCHFSNERREGAPIKNPPEWSKFDRILTDPDTSRRKEMIQEVVEKKRTPSDVWAKRQQEILKLDWEKWLIHMQTILKTADIDTTYDVEEIQTPLKWLVHIISELDERDNELRHV